MDSQTGNGMSFAGLAAMGLIGLGAVALARRPAWLGATLLGFLTYELFQASGGKPAASRASDDDRIDQASADSFPASDPPSWTGSVAGSA